MFFAALGTRMGATRGRARECGYAGETREKTIAHLKNRERRYRLSGSYQAAECISWPGETGAAWGNAERRRERELHERRLGESCRMRSAQLAELAPRTYLDDYRGQFRCDRQGFV